MDMPDNYSPLDLIKLRHANAIFNNELKMLAWSPELEDMRGTDWKHVWAIFGVEIGVLIALAICNAGIQRMTPYGTTILSGLALLLMVFVPLASTFIVDIYTVSRIVNFWHIRTHADWLDVLRLTVPTDGELVNTLQAVGELHVWRGMRWEMALRSLIPFCGIFLCGFVGVILLIGLMLSISHPYSKYDLGVSLSVALFCAWLTRMLMLFVREPLWRMRALVTVSIAVADNIKETNMAILVGSAVALGLKSAQISVVTGIVIITIYALQPRTHPIVSVLWVVGSGWFTTRMVRAAYAGLAAWGTRVTLRSLQGQSEPLLDTLRSITQHLSRDTSAAESL